MSPAYTTTKILIKKVKKCRDRYNSAFNDLNILGTGNEFINSELEEAGENPIDPPLVQNYVQDINSIQLDVQEDSEQDSNQDSVIEESKEESKDVSNDDSKNYSFSAIV